MRRVTVLGIAAAATAFVGLAGCTEKQRARSFGGESSIDLPCDKKLFDVTWKGDNIWFVTREMRDDESAEEYSFQEESSFGMLEGTVTFKESRCEPAS